MDPEATENKPRITGRLGKLLPHISNIDLERNRHYLPISHLLSISDIRTIPARIKCPRLPKSSRYNLQKKLQEKRSLSDRPSSGPLRFEDYKFYPSPHNCFQAFYPQSTPQTSTHLLLPCVITRPSYFAIQTNQYKK